jgi:GT2 family glycosyltransferase
MRIIVGIATYNRLKKLERLLKSIYCQTYPADIAIMFDNNDNDTKKYITQEDSNLIDK